MKTGLPLLLLLILFFQSKNSHAQRDITGSLTPPNEGETFIKLSLDLARTVLTGPSYEDFIKNGNIIGFNAAYFFNPEGAVRRLKGDYDNTTHPDDHEFRAMVNSAPGLETLIASNDAFHSGSVYDTALVSKGKFYSLIGIQLIGKGGKYKDRFGSVLSKSTYLEIPAYVMYKYPLPKTKGSVFGGAGLYIAYGLFGKTKYDGPGFKDTQSTFDKDLGFKRFDFGLAFTAGYQLPQGLRLSLEYEFGLITIVPVTGEDKTKNRVLSLNVGYPLAKIIKKFKAN